MCGAGDRNPQSRLSGGARTGEEGVYADEKLAEQRENQTGRTQGNTLRSQGKQVEKEGHAQP